MPPRRSRRPLTLARERRIFHDKVRGYTQEDLAVLRSRTTDVEFRCNCRPEDGHDHEATIEDWKDRLAARDAVVDGYLALAQPKKARRLGGASVRITDCQIEVWGPRRYRLYVGWEDGNGKRFEWASEYAETASEFPAPAEVLKIISQRMGGETAKLRQMRRLGASFR